MQGNPWQIFRFWNVSQHILYTQKSKSNNYDSTSEFCIKQYSNLLGIEHGDLLMRPAVSGQSSCCVVIVQVFSDVETFSAVDQLGFGVTDRFWGASTRSVNLTCKTLQIYLSQQLINIATNPNFVTFTIKEKSWGNLSTRIPDVLRQN